MPFPTNPFDKTVEAEARQIRDDSGVTNQDLKDMQEAQLLLLGDLRISLEQGVPGVTI
jgi:hypothetical protein